jgi:uncharacterized membrane protein
MGGFLLLVTVVGVVVVVVCVVLLYLKRTSPTNVGDTGEKALTTTTS